MKLEYQEGTLADRRLDLIELWATQMAKDAIIGPLNLSHAQRRHIASLLWWREVCKSNEHMRGWRQQPKPVVGIDAKQRIVVQSYNDRSNPSDRIHQYALTRGGDPTEIWEPVISLRTGERLMITDRINVHEEK
jgi:hypothetical protein